VVLALVLLYVMLMLVEMLLLLHLLGGGSLPIRRRVEIGRKIVSTPTAVFWVVHVLDVAVDGLRVWRVGNAQELIALVF